MTVDYAKTAARAAASLARKGARTTITRTTAGEYDPETGTQAVTVVNHACVALESQSERSYIDGSLIQAGAMVYLVAAKGLSITPKSGDTLAWGGATRTVDKVLTLAPAGLPLLHELHTVT